METETIDAVGENSGRVSELLDMQNAVYAGGFETLLVPLSLFVMFALAFCFFLAQKNKRELEKTQELCLGLRNDLQIAASSAIGMGQRIISLEKKLGGSIDSGIVVNSSEKTKQIKSKNLSLKGSASRAGEGSFAETFLQETGGQRGPAPKLQAVKFAESNYQHQGASGELNSFDKASELLKNGMCEEDVAKRCELSSSETALMAMVVKKKAASI